MENNAKRKMRLTINLKSYKCWAFIALAVLCAVLCIIAGASITATIVLVLAIAVLAPVQVSCSSKSSMWLEHIWSVCTMPVVLFITQILLNQETLGIDIFKLLLGCLVVGILTGFLIILFRRIKPAAICSVILLMLLTTVNYFVYSFRGSEFAPYDFLAFGTAADVAGQYKYQIDAPFAYAWCIAVFWIALGCCVRRGGRCPHGVKSSVLLIIAEISAIVILCIGLKTVDKLDYRNQGTAINGYLLNFVKKIDFTPIEVPENYDTRVVKELELAYFCPNTENSDRPDIIVIMNESFADLRVIGELQTNMEVLSFYDSILTNTIHGYALASSIGGGTCNSEWQFLTGNNMGFVTDGAYPYQQYIQNPTWSIFAEMELAGYQTIATHPEQSQNWMRGTVYPLFGIDDFSFIEEYPQENLIRNHVSDQEAYEKLIDLYETAYTNDVESVVLFAVTMQNHGGYTIENYQSHVSLENYSQPYPEIEQYLSLIHSSDEALRFLISYYEQVDRDVVILFFGDHMPQFAGTFYEELHGGSFDTLEEQMLQYTVPFFVWANFDIEERDVGLTSLNFLSNYVYEVAGLPLPAYNAFLKDVQSVIPALNAFGYYSKDRRTIIPYDEAEGKEAEMLNLYRILQYNCLFDKDNRSHVFFPTTP